MSFASASEYKYGDGADEGSSTQVGVLILDGTGGLILSGLAPASSNLPSGSDLRAKVDQGLSMALADPSSGFVLDITDDSSTATDVHQLVYTEPSPAAVPPVEAKWGVRGGVYTQEMSQDTFLGLAQHQVGVFGDPGYVPPGALELAGF